MNDFFNLPVVQKRLLLEGVSASSGGRATILEKDVWLCHVLGKLFSLPCRKPMAFKGGTSLSKVYRAIDRFSEDIDITIDCHSLVDNFPDVSTISNTQLRKLSDSLRISLKKHVLDELVPSLSESLSGYNVRLEIEDDAAEKLRIHYPSVVHGVGDYLGNNILIEFGGRNDIEPKNKVEITPDLAAHVLGMSNATVMIDVLAPERTFWEKVTLIHTRCHRPDLPLNTERIARHWYDLARLADHPIGDQALTSASAGVQLWEDILKMNRAFFRSSFSNFDKCLTGGLRLVPNEELRNILVTDYQRMQAAGMFYGDIPSFEHIMNRLGSLEDEINQLVLDTYRPRRYRLKE